MKSELEQLLLFELTTDERAEMIGLLEFDYRRFPRPKCSKKHYFPAVTGDMIDEEVQAWLRRSRRIDSYIDKTFKTVK